MPSAPGFLFRRRGGAADWLGLFAASGSAAACGARSVAPIEERDEVAPAAAGQLLAGWLLEPSFLERRLDVDRKISLPDPIRLLALRQLFVLRARAAAFTVAVEVELGLSGEAWRDRYRARMVDATLASWPAALAARDGDAAQVGASRRRPGGGRCASSPSASMWITRAIRAPWR